MIPPQYAAYVPYAALAAATIVWLSYLLWAFRSARIGRRPLLATIAVIATLPAIYVALTWARVIPERWVRFERPLLALPVSIVVLFVVHRLLSLSERQSSWRRGLTELLMAGSALVAALSALGIEIGKPLDRLAVIVALDKSRSIDLVVDAESRIVSELQVAELGMRDDDRIGTIAFAAESAVEDPLRPRTRLPAPQKAEIGRDGTDIGEGIRRALAEVPADAAARIVIISDGVNTRGDPLEAAAAAVAAGVPIDVVPLDQAKVPDVRLVGVRMSPRASEGEMMEMRIVTASSAPADVELRISKDGQLVRKGTAKIGAGEDVLRLREQAPGPGLHRYDVEITAADPKLDQAPEDNAGSAFVRVRGQAAALVMEGNPERAKPLVSALEAAAYRVDTVGTGGVPADIAGFAAYDVVVLSDIAASDLAPTQIEALASYTRDLGGGLLLMGGDRSMGPGGYGKTAIEEVSPVSFDLKQERRRASLAEVIAIDYSGSMAMRVGRQTKLDLANEAAARSAELLGAGDRLGVMHVDTSIQWTVPLGPVTDKAAITKAIRAVGPGGGGIYVDLTLQNAYEALSREKVNLKHLLLFSDGDDAEERANAFALVTTAKSRGITTSVVALGRGSDVSALERMSQLGGGRFYLIEDAARLPAVFAQETILAARSSINEESFKPVASTPGPPTRGVSIDTAPALGGYVVTIPKGRAQVHLRGPEGDPILAVWSVGVGRAAAFTSDYKDRWGSEWTKWSDGARLFAQLARDITRLADDPRVRLEADATGGQLHVRATVVDDDGRTESFRRLEVRVGGPDGFRREVALEATGAGAYSATVPLSRPGAYVATAIDELGEKPVATTGAVLTAGEELRPTGSDRALLARITELTAGKTRDTLAGVFEDRDAKRFAYKSYTLPFLLVAALAMLLGVAARRLALPERLANVPARFRERWRARRERKYEAARAHMARDAQQTLDALRDKKSRSEVAPNPDRPPPIATAPLVVDARRDAPPPSVPRFGGEQRRPTASSGEQPPPAPPSQRQASAAEILLARRRGKRL